MTNSKGLRKGEILNSYSHGVGALFSMVGFIVLLVMSAQSVRNWSIISTLIYGLSLVTLYVASTVYHSVSEASLKKYMRIFDHASIFLLIAGTYTPFLLISIGGVVGWTIFSLQWGLALLGITLKVVLKNRYQVMSLVMYLIMGWMAIVKIDLFYNAIDPAGFWMVISGGIAYTIGVVFYVLDDKVKLGHFIWHLFVMAGSVFHYLAIALWVI